ncbi:acyloxyacyl hydrolase [Pseudopedobacter beijingensis]|uniref:Acyloxyacyl hydrolase n=1 Tax=Pseudopedobacter beijingensis TaxID=1207056 RepID=A0ABW4IF52_9SPHI
MFNKCFNRAFLPFALLLFTGGAVKSQSYSGADAVEIKLQKTFAYFPSHYKLSNDIYGGELIYHKQTENKDWAKKLSIKSVDFIFDFKNTQQLLVKGEGNQFGNSYALLSGLSFQLYKNNLFNININPSLGLGYTQQTFYTNGNTIIGSRVNLYSRAALNLEAPLSEKTSLSLSVGVLHFSNGAMRVPNDGMNMGNFGISLKRRLENNLDKNTDDAPEQRFKKHNLELGLNLGRRGVYKSKDGLYKTGLYAGYSYRISSFIDLGVGTDAVYYYTIYDPNRNEETYQSKATSLDRWRIGVAAGPSIWLSNFAIDLKYGYYLHFNSLHNTKMYWNAGVKYKLTDWFSLQAKGYIHGTEVDCIAAGLNFSL